MGNGRVMVKMTPGRKKKSAYAKGKGRLCRGAKAKRNTECSENGKKTSNWKANREGGRGGKGNTLRLEKQAGARALGCSLDPPDALYPRGSLNVADSAA